MSQKRSISARGPRKKSRAGICSSQYTLDDDELLGVEPESEPVRIWKIGAAGNGRYSGHRKTTKVTATQSVVANQPETEVSADGAEPEDPTWEDITVDVPDLLRSKDRKRKQRNDSVSLYYGCLILQTYEIFTD